MAFQITHIQAPRQQAFAQAAELAVDQPGCRLAFRPKLATQAALAQLCLDLHRAKGREVESQLDTPQGLQRVG